jgi:hypothetical protein
MGAPDVVTVDVDLPDVYDYPDLTSVGRLYQVGINGVGYMLADKPDEPAWSRQTVPLDPQRLATSDTPFTEAIERYSFSTNADFSGGSGQRYLHRPKSDATAYYSSEGVDPFTTPGQITLLPGTTQEVSSAYAGLKTVAVGNRLFVLDSANTVSYYDTPGGSGTSVTITGAGTVSDLATDGINWYAADGANIYRGNTGSSSWSTIDGQSVMFAGGRICTTVASASTAPNRFTTLNDSGAEEKANGHITLPVGTTLVLGGETSGHIYFGARAGSTGSIYAWKLGLDTGSNFHAPFEALELPAGLVPTAVTAAGGMVWVRAHRPEGTNKGQAVILRCIPTQDGSLIASTLTEIVPTGGSVDHSVGAFATHGDLVFFGWKTMANSHAGIGAVDLSGGGWAKWLEAGTDGDVASIDVWQGYPVFTVVGQGVYRSNPTTSVAAGHIVTSIGDGGSVLDKLWDDVVLVGQALPGGASISVDYSLDDYGSWTNLGSVSTAGTSTRTLAFNKEAKASALKVSLARTGTNPPVLSLVQARYHPLGLRDTLVRLVVDCGDQLKGLNGAPLTSNGPGNGARRARHLESLVQRRIKYQDIDWHILSGSEVYEVESCDVSSTLIYDRATSGQAIRLLAQMTIRKVG